MTAQGKSTSKNLLAIYQELLSALEEQGCKGRLASISHLSDMKEGIERYYRLGHFDEEFYQERLVDFVFSPPDNFQEAQSLIIVAYPHPQTRIKFAWNGKVVHLIIPPTYLYGSEGDKRIQNLLSATLEPAGYRVAETSLLPKKLLAVSSGLGAYGKNNICYVEGMGSFVRLVAFYSDFSCEEGNWQEPQMMEACFRCSACVHKCPTGAITSKRFLLHAERCITYWNEKPGNVPFPSWLEPSWHNCLVGCLICQKICPQNKDFFKRIEIGATFSQRETTMLLEGIALDQLPARMVEKLVRFDLVDYLDILPRNLNVLL